MGLLKGYFSLSGSAYPASPFPFALPLFILGFLIKQPQTGAVLTERNKRKKPKKRPSWLSIKRVVLYSVIRLGISYLMAGGDGAPCGACKFLRRKCVKGCIFSPYFSTEELGAAHFAAIHKIFGASNFSKLLQHISSEEERFDAVVSVSYEAQARLQDPIYGCVSHIFALQHQVAHLQAELSFANARLAGNSMRTLLSRHHQNQLDDISAPSANRSHGHYILSNQLESHNRSASENTGFPHQDKSSNLLMQMQDYCHNPPYSTQQKDGFHDDIDPLKAYPEHGGDLQALAFSLLRSRS